MRRRSGTPPDRSRAAIQGCGMVCDGLRAEGRIEFEHRRGRRDEEGGRNQSGFDGISSTGRGSRSGSGECIERDEEISRAA